jgi:hypothetical protein
VVALAVVVSRTACSTTRGGVGWRAQEGCTWCCDTGERSRGEDRSAWPCTQCCLRVSNTARR